MRRVLILATLVAALAVVLPGPVTAAKPQPFTDQVDVSFVVNDVCAFSYTQTFKGTVSGRTFVDKAGNPVREVARLRFDGTFAANGIIVPFIVRQVDHATFNEDGSVTVASSGIIGRAAGGATIGRLVITYPADDGEPIVDFEAGQNNEDEFFGPILCGMLTP